MVLHNMLTSGKSGVAARAICFCVAHGKPTKEDITAIQSFTIDPIGQELIANRPLSAYADAALHVFGAKSYHGSDSNVLDAITMLTSETNLKDIRSCEEYNKIFN